MDNRKYNEGGIFEFAEWEIQFDEVVYTHPCRHCIKDGDGDFICPAAVIAKNEGGYNRTGICLRCIIEANDILKKAE